MVNLHYIIYTIKYLTWKHIVPYATSKYFDFIYAFQKDNQEKWDRVLPEW